MGVTLVRHNGGPKGYYDHTTRTISTRRGMSIAQYRSTLAHELGHAHYGHQQARMAHLDTRHERQADEFAAELLLTEELVHDACASCGGHPGAIAEELEVTEHLLAVWHQLHPHTHVGDELASA